jgi:hypothetical protein
LLISLITLRVELNVVTRFGEIRWVAGLHAVLPRLLRVATDSSLGVDNAQQAKWWRLLSTLPPLPTSNTAANGSKSVFVAAQEPYPPHAVLGGSEQPFMYVVHPYRLATVCNGGVDLEIGRRTMAKTNDKVGDGWYQGVMNAALLGLRDVAAAAVLNHAATSHEAMRFPAYLPSMQVYCFALDACQDYYYVCLRTRWQ